MVLIIAAQIFLNDNKSYLFLIGLVLVSFVFLKYLLVQISRLFYRTIRISISIESLFELIDVIIAETQWEYGEINQETIQLTIQKSNQPTMFFYIIHKENRLYLHCLHEDISFFDFKDDTTRTEINWFENKLQEQKANRHIRAILRREIAVERQLNK